MQRASIAIGVFSGVLTVTSAAGLPTVFIQTDRGFVTGDFDCFTPSQTLLPDAAYREISNLLSDPQAYEHARQLAMRNAREYYNEGQNATLDGSFFKNFSPQTGRNEA